MSETSRRVEVFSGEKVTLSSEATVQSVEFNWQAFGCSSNLCLRLGDKVLQIPLPDGFPQESLRFEKEDVVYDRPQSVTLTSTPDRVPTNVELKLSIDQITVPFILMIDGVQLLAGLECERRYPVYGKDGELLWEVVIPVHTEFEQNVLSGGACRPNCRWTSLIQTRLEYPWQLVRVEIPSHGRYVVHHYRRRVDYNWASFHCEGGSWAFKRNDVDTQSETKRVRLAVHSGD